MVLTDDEHAVQEFPPNASDEPFRIGILPRALWGRADCLHAHAYDAPLQPLATHRIAVPETIPMDGLPEEGLDQLLGGPLRFGWAVTLQWITFRRWWASMISTRSALKPTVETVK